MFRPRTVAAAAALLFLVTPGTRADMPPSGAVRQVTPQLRFDNLDDYPDYRFYLQYRRGDGNPYAAPLQIVEVTAGQPVPVAGQGRRVADLALLAARRGQALPDFPPDTRGPAPEFPGFLRATNLEEPATTTSLFDATSYYLTPYRVAVRDGKLEVTALREEAIYPGGRAGRAFLPYWPAAAALAAALAALGVWLTRRRTGRSRAAAPPPALPPH